MLSMSTTPSAMSFSELAVAHSRDCHSCCPLRGRRQQQIGAKGLIIKGNWGVIAAHAYSVQKRCVGAQESLQFSQVHCGGWLNETDQSQQRPDGLHQSEVFDGFTRYSTVAKLKPLGSCGIEFVYRSCKCRTLTN